MIVPAMLEVSSFFLASSWVYISRIRAVPSSREVSNSFLPSSTSWIRASILALISGLMRIGTERESPSMRVKPVSRIETVFPLVSK